MTTAQLRAHAPSSAPSPRAPRRVPRKRAPTSPQRARHKTPREAPRRGLRRALLGLVALATLSAGSACTRHRPALERFHAQNRVAAGAFPDVPAVVLLDRTELTFSYSASKERPYARALHTLRIQIQAPEGLEYAKLRIPVDDRSGILHVQARVIRASGEVIDMPPDRVVALPRFAPGTPAAALYEGEGVLLTRASGASVGDVVEFSYVRVMRDPRWLEPIAIGGELPVVRGEVVIDYPLGFDVDYRVTRLGQLATRRPSKLPTRIRDERGGEGVPGTRLVFLFENEPAVYPEEGRPALEALRAQVHLALRAYRLQGQTYEGYRSWDDVAAWYRELTAGAAKPDAALKKALREGGGRGGSKRERLLRVQRILQDDIRDVPSFLHLAALPARAPGEVWRAGVGDAKDQASLGLALLRELDIDAYPVLVSRAGTFASLPDLPTPAPFNHVVLAIPMGGSTWFIDPATPYLPAGRLPGALQGQRGLGVRGERAEVMDLPVDEPAHNTRTFRYEVQLSHEGRMWGQLNIELSGLDAAAARSLLQEGGGDLAARLRALLGEDPESPWSFGEVEGVEGEAGDPDQPLRLRLALAPVMLTAPQGSTLPIEVGRIWGRPLALAWRESRRAPLLLGHRREERHEISLRLPEGMGLASVPGPAGEENAWYRYQEKSAVADGVWWLERRSELPAHIIVPGQYSTFRAALARLWQAQSEPVAIVPGGERGSTYNEAPF